MNLKKVEVYECPECGEYISEVKAVIDFELKFDIERYIDGEINERNLTEVASEELEINCPECGAQLN